MSHKRLARAVHSLFGDTSLVRHEDTVEKRPRLRLWEVDKHHDGGQEDNRVKLEEVVQGADLVFCPIDCISHDAGQKAKTCCRRTGTRFLPLRSSGASSFAVGLEKAVGPEHAARIN